MVPKEPSGRPPDPRKIDYTICDRLNELREQNEIQIKLFNDMQQADNTFVKNGENRIETTENDQAKENDYSKRIDEKFEAIIQILVGWRTEIVTDKIETGNNDMDNTGKENTETISKSKSESEGKSINSNLAGNKDMDNPETATVEDADDNDDDNDTDNKDIEDAYWSDMLSVIPEEQIEFENENEDKDKDKTTEIESKHGSESNSKSKRKYSNFTGNQDMDNPETATAEDADADADAEAVIATDVADNKGHTAIMKDMEDLEEEHAFWSDMLSVIPEEQIEFETDNDNDNDNDNDHGNKTETETETENKQENKKETEDAAIGPSDEEKHVDKNREYDLIDEFDGDNEHISMEDNGNNGNENKNKNGYDNDIGNSNELGNENENDISNRENDLMDEFNSDIELMDDFYNNYGPITEYGDYNEEELILEFDEMNVTDNKVAKIIETNQQLDPATDRKKTKKKKRPNNIAYKKLKTYNPLKPTQAFWYRDKLLYDAYSKKKRNKKYDDCHSEFPQ